MFHNWRLHISYGDHFTLKLANTIKNHMIFSCVCRISRDWYCSRCL